MEYNLEDWGYFDEEIWEFFAKELDLDGVKFDYKVTDGVLSLEGEFDYEMADLEYLIEHEIIIFETEDSVIKLDAAVESLETVGYECTTK